MKGHIHLHTTASDGLIEPEDIIEAGLDFVAITDHDILDSIEKFKVLESQGIKVIPGIELSARHMGKNIHMLVYYPKYNPEFLNVLNEFKQARFNRAVKIANKLRDSGFKLTDEEILGEKGIVSKGNVAHIVFSYQQNRHKLKKEGIDSEDSFIKTYLHKGKPANVELQGMEISKLFQLVDGVKVLAHPGYNLDLKKHDYIIEDLVKNYDLFGMEVWTRKHTEKEKEYYHSLAKKLSLYATKSNDVHRRDQLKNNIEDYFTAKSLQIENYFITERLERKSQMIKQDPEPRQKKIYSPHQQHKLQKKKY